MKRYFGFIFMGVLLVSLSLELSASTPVNRGSKVFAGEITDTFCAMNGSHTQMMNGMSSMGKDKESCTRQCVRLGASYMLLDPATRTVYHLDQPEKAEPFAGQSVRIAGTLEEGTIKVAKIEAAN